MADVDLTRFETWLVIGAGVGVSIYQMTLLKKGLATSGWPRVTGTIVQSGMKTVDWAEYETYEDANIHYRYTVNGKEHQNSRISFEKVAGWEDEKMQKEMIARYPAGEKVWVYYHPEDPSQAVLQPFSSLSRCLLIIIGGLGMAALPFL